VYTVLAFGAAFAVITFVLFETGRRAPSLLLSVVGPAGGLANMALGSSRPLHHDRTHVGANREDETSFEGILLVFVLAVLANVCYCAAYLGDVFVQISGLREVWQKWRSVLFVVGTTFAAIITRWSAIGFFTA
jgi:hypothetical protein